MLNLEKDIKELVRYCDELDEWIFEEQEMPDPYLLTPSEITNYISKRTVPQRCLVEDKREI